ncbi:MAG: DUF3048 domain-containing protein [Propionicimonas sp.]|uniref:DUF3048 domain-containing protein n=1 Tax=Propionicimonas sp. TaxID=1955623 RepID=UPI002B206539|nr:DUF3048 domain-containing protein [Propionicimonas sp.]MEA4943760.1 DUF3048 domain-containing protein [Propionicimonas sp.]
MGAVSRRSVLVGVAGVAGAAAVAGCTGQPAPSGSNSAPPPSPGGSASETPTPSPTPTGYIDTTPRWPLTGVPFKDGEEKKAAHSAVAVKVPVEKRSFPQSGVDSADLVFVQAQGKSYDTTRLCAVFHSKFPAEGANPVRSTRPVDVALLAPLKPVLACTGATPWVLKYVRKNKKYIELREKYGDRTDRWKLWNPGGWWKGGNLSDKSVVAMPKALSRDAKLAPDVVPPVYLQYAQPDEDASTANGTAVKRITITYAGSMTEYHRWTWSGDSFKKAIRFHESATWYDWKVRKGKQVTAPNVLIVYCAWKMGVLKGYSGHTEPLYSIIDGSDKFVYLHDGKYVTGTWKKAGVADRFEFTLDDGTPLKMAPGRTWVEMPNHNAKVEFK